MSLKNQEILRGVSEVETFVIDAKLLGSWGNF